VAKANVCCITRGSIPTIWTGVQRSLHSLICNTPTGTRDIRISAA